MREARDEHPVAEDTAPPPEGSRLPAETDPHECTLVGWPTRTRTEQLWGDVLEDARDVHAAVVHALARFEKVIVVADPDEAVDAAARCGDVAEVLALPVDDSWLRDSGPIVVRDRDRARHAVHFRFNAWGEKFTPWDRDAVVGGLIAARLGLPCHAAPFVAEGGAFASDGGGTIVTTERCLLNPNRNPGHSRDEIETLLRRWLGAERVVWLADAIAEDDGTDGHVDNVVAFFAPCRALLQGCDAAANPNSSIAAENRARLLAAGIDVTEIDVLPYATVLGRAVPVPYINLYPVNGGVLVPTTGHAADSDALAVIAACYPGREVVEVPGAVLAYGGGGVHCITQQVPAA